MDSDQKLPEKLPAVTHIVAYDQKTRGIGYKNDLIYKLKKDLQHFRNTTLNHVVIIGRKTYESVGRLPRRINVVLTHQANLCPKDYDIHVFSDITTAIKWCQEIFPQKTIFVIGGAEIYKATLPYTTSVIATEIESSSDVLTDTFYPELPKEFILQDNEKVELDIDQCTQTVKTFRIKTFHKN